MTIRPDDAFGHEGLNAHVDADALLDDIALDAEEIAWRKEFIQFDEEDERRLSDLESLFRDRQNEIADRFYENLTSYDGSLEIMGRSPKGIEALKQTQRAYLVSLATGAYGEEYFRNRARIGKLHELMNMPMKYYVGQYGVYYDLILSEIDERVQRQTVDAIEAWADEELGSKESTSGFVDRFLGGGAGGDEADGLDETLEETVRESIHDGMADILAVLRIVNLDLQVATDTYFESYSRELDQAVERRNALATSVQRDVYAPIEELDDASSSVARSAQTINDLAASQADDMDTIADEVESLSANVQEIAATAESVDQVSTDAESLADSGVEQANAALEELEAVQSVAAELTETVSRLEERTAAIDEVIDRVDKLTERTKVLGTNASVEAKRGENAQGTLEVIASEVQSFAGQTQTDLEAVEREVEEIKAVATETVDRVEETTDRLATGVDRVDDAVLDFEAIHDATEHTSEGIDDVATAAADQASSAEAIYRTIQQSAQKADRVSGETESVAAATEEQTVKLSEIARSVGTLTSIDDVERRPVYER
ncbi:globin-coupled sensor protein [Natronobeatus ordinarius]|uniref:globin-coupled sensor protein n=1 Tax=Natronobeatus ordinarius TaxID=2963433 RepID=UPI0020CF4953|nr:globin-coupled sensor protein [Natronobeatus ordinarius]